MLQAIYQGRGRSRGDSCLVALHLSDELPALGSQAREDGVEVVDGEGEMAEARRVRGRVPVAGRAWRGVELDQLEPSVAARIVMCDSSSMPQARMRRRASSRL